MVDGSRDVLGGGGAGRRAEPAHPAVDLPQVADLDAAAPAGFVERGDRLGAVDGDPDPDSARQRDQALEAPIPDRRRGEQKVLDAFGGEAFGLGERRDGQARPRRARAAGRRSPATCASWRGV